MKKTKTAKLFGLAVLAAIALGTAACNLATSGFGTITMPGEWPEIPPLPPSEPAEPSPVLPPPPPSFSLANEQRNDLWRWVVTADDTVIITRYIGPYPDGGHIDIPSTLDGLPVAALARPTVHDGQYLFLGIGVFGGLDDDINVHTMLTSVRIPAGLVSIGSGAFAFTQFTHFDIPYGVTYIGPYAFVQASSLSSVSIPESVTRINEQAFAGTALTRVVIPASVTYIGWGAFPFSTELHFLGAIPSNMVGSGSSLGTHH